ncbi:unnamed protein product [Cercospora beticola]|nr:unnamed protein product [Cercospora beticola]
MDVPDSTALTASSSVNDASPTARGLTTIPRELRDEIYKFVDGSTPYQCRRCSTVVYGDDGSVQFQDYTYTPSRYAKTRRGPQFKTSYGPFIGVRCRLRLVMSNGGLKACGRAHSIAFLRINPSDETQQHHTLSGRLQIVFGPNASIAKRVEFPAIAHVNQQLRAEVLSDIFRKNKLYATVFDVQADSRATKQRIEDMGQECAGAIRAFYIVYSKKKAYKYIMKVLLPDLEAAGVKSEAMKVLRLTQDKFVPDVEDENMLVKQTLPGCKCESCILRFLRKKDRETKDG